MPATNAEGKTGLVRRMYDWVLGWSETAYGPQALLGLAFCEAIFFPVPPDVLLMALVLGRRERAWNFAMLCTIGSVAGGIIGYLIGAGLWEAVSGYFFTWVPGFSQAGYDRVRVFYETYSFWAVFAAGFTPIPYKIFTISAGVFEISMPIFMLASVMSRGLRFVLIAGLLWKFGDPIKSFIDRYFNLLAFGGTALLIGGFVLLKYL
ncbi:MAG: DedA family protein [Chrysiogenetes bacterium]|nr:DedA family protein [Chrysiogenetes bacterium]